MYYFFAIIFGLLCLYLFGPIGFLLSVLILIILLSIDSTVISIGIIGGIFVVILHMFEDSIRNFFKKIEKPNIVIMSYFGVYVGIFATLTYAECDWWMFFSYLLFIISQLLFTLVSFEFISKTNSFFLKGVTSVNMLICAIISLFPIFFRFFSLSIYSPIINLHFDKYEGGILVYLLTLVTFTSLIIIFISVINVIYIKRKQKKIINKQFVLGAIITILVHLSIFYCLFKEANVHCDTLYIF